VKPYYKREGIYIFNADCREVKLPETPSLVLTDPPYGISLRTNYKDRMWSDRHVANAASKNYAPIYDDDKEFDPTWMLALNTRTCLFGANNYAHKLPISKGWIIWDKKDARAGGDQGDAELAWTNFLGCCRLFHHMWMGICKDSENGDKRCHPTQKPIELMRWILAGTIGPKLLVFDPYMGAGSTLIAAAMQKKSVCGG
jgi:site-specific DNA-methyltransferase (adenine-specific)